MPRKKKLTYEDKRRSVIQKLIFAGVIVLLVLLVNFFVLRNRPVEPETSEKPDSEATVLGESDSSTETFEDRVATIQEQAIETATELEGAAETVIETGRAQAEKTISTVVYETTLKPIIDKVQSLPQNQKEVIQEAVCTPLSEPTTE